MRISRVLALVVLTLSANSLLALGGGGGGGGGFGGGPGGGGGFGAPAGGTNALGINTNFYTNEYDLMSAQVTLTDDQKPKVKARVDAMNSELQALLLTVQNVTPAAGGFGGGGGGRGGAPAATSAPLTPEQVKARDDYRFLADQHQVKINSELTDAQKLQWETYKLNTLLDPKVATLSLTEDQKSKIKVLVAETAKSLAAMTDAKEIDLQEGKLIRKVVAEVLTEPQAARLFELPLGTNAGGRGGVAAAGRGAPGGGGAGGGFGGGGPGGGGGRGGRGG